MENTKKDSTEETQSQSQSLLKDELEDKALDNVSGGVRRRTGDEDLEDLEVER